MYHLCMRRKISNVPKDGLCCVVRQPPFANAALDVKNGRCNQRGLAWCYAVLAKIDPRTCVVCCNRPPPVPKTDLPIVHTIHANLPRLYSQLPFLRSRPPPPPPPAASTRCGFFLANCSSLSQTEAISSLVSPVTSSPAARFNNGPAAALAPPAGARSPVPAFLSAAISLLCFFFAMSAAWAMIPA